MGNYHPTVIENKFQVYPSGFKLWSVTRTGMGGLFTLTAMPGEIASVICCICSSLKRGGGCRRHPWAGPGPQHYFPWSLTFLLAFHLPRLLNFHMPSAGESCMVVVTLWPKTRKENGYQPEITLMIHVHLSKIYWYLSSINQCNSDDLNPTNLLYVHYISKAMILYETLQNWCFLLLLSR